MAVGLVGESERLGVWWVWGWCRVGSGNASSVKPTRALAAPRAVIEGHNSTDSLHERHERISTVGYCDVVDWQRHLTERLAPATVNNHPASLSGFTTWVSAQARAVRDR